jgi:hypothetical protein
MELAQVSLLMTAWVVAFRLGRELQTAFLQWRRFRRGEQPPNQPG